MAEHGSNEIMLGAGSETVAMNEWFADLDTLHRAFLCALSVWGVLGSILVPPEFEIHVEE
jgi:hypothetical protein